MDKQILPLHAAIAFGNWSDFLSFSHQVTLSPPRSWSFILTQEETGFRWHLFEEDSNKFYPTDCLGENIGLACHFARMKWARYGFRTLRCGTLLTLPERDEVGSPALFHEMIQSLSISSGVVFDPGRGYSFRVDQISEEAIQFYKRIKNNL